MIQIVKREEVAVGKVIIVPSRGPCLIQAIQEEELYGCSDTYVTLTACGRETDGTITIPLSQFEKQSIRHPINPGQMLEVLEHLRDRDRRFIGKPHQKEMHFRQLCNSADPRLLATCVHGLWTADGVERSAIFRHIYEEALTRFAREVAIVFHTPYPGVRGALESIIANHTPPEDLFGSNKKAVPTT